MILQQQLMLYLMGKFKKTKEIKNFLKDLRRWNKMK